MKAIQTLHGVIERRTLFPPLTPLKIIDIHRLMMHDDILPATIKRAQTQEMHKLRDISLTLSAIYISKDDRIAYIAEYFNLSREETLQIIANTKWRYNKEIQHYQEQLKESYGSHIAWDVEKDAPLSHQRYEELRPKLDFKGLKSITVPLIHKEKN